MRVEALVEQLGEGEGVARVRVHRGKRRLTCSEVVRMRGVDPIEVQHRALADYPIGLDLSDHPRQILAQLEGDRDLAIEVAEEDQIGHADLGRCIGLLDPTTSGTLLSRARQVAPTGITVSDQAVGDLDPRLGHLGDGAGGTEVHVIGMGGDHQHT